MSKHCNNTTGTQQLYLPLLKHKLSHRAISNILYLKSPERNFMSGHIVLLVEELMECEPFQQNILTYPTVQLLLLKRTFLNLAISEKVNRPQITNNTKSWYGHDFFLYFKKHPPSLIRDFAVRMRNPWVLSYPLSAQQRLWSDWEDAQADLSLRWAHMPLCWFCHAVAQIIFFASISFVFSHVGIEEEFIVYKVNTYSLWEQYL